VVVREVWDQDILPDNCEGLVVGECSTIWVAESKASVEGFASGFLTRDSSGERRGEIDLLAVRPSRQGEGIGPRLIAGLGEEAASWDLDVLRALIRVENLPSQKAFIRVGYTTDSCVHQLHLWAPQQAAEVGTIPEGISMIPVNTVTYRGLWIEGLTTLDHEAQRAVVSSARALIARENRLNAGALIPSTDAAKLAPDLVQEATLQGDYFWFRKEPG
jgi:GNAT superfamily N-acetyltransferase